MKSKILRLIFLKETIILIFALVWLWFSIGLLVDSSYSVGDLKAHNGVVVSLDSVITRVINKPLYKEIKQELRLGIDSETGYFTLTTTANFGFITNKVNVGDTVFVYTKPKLWGMFGLKSGSDINHLTKGQEIILNYNDYKTSISGFFYFTLLFSIILFIIYIVQLRKRLWLDFDGYLKYQAQEKTNALGS
jgi:hypothetical protein